MVNDIVPTTQNVEFEYLICYY